MNTQQHTSEAFSKRSVQQSVQRSEAFSDDGLEALGSVPVTGHVSSEVTKIIQELVALYENEVGAWRSKHNVILNRAKDFIHRAGRK